MAKKIKLTVELVPTTCHYSNIRTTVTTKDWDKIRHISYENANNKCEICGDDGLNQGYKHRVECHEIWKYDDKKKIQKLSGLISLCPTCHQVKHIGRAFCIGKQPEVFNQLEKINNWDHKTLITYIAEVFEQNKERSKPEWTLNLDLLTKSPYNIEIKIKKKRNFKRKFKYKKRRKK